MHFDRRRFITRSLYAGGLALSFPELLLLKSQDEPDAKTPFFGVSQGMTNSTSAQFTVLVNARIHHGLRVLDGQNQVITHQLLRREDRTFSSWAIEKYLVDGLELGKSYRLQFIDQNSGRVLDERNFKTLNLENHSNSFALVSCANDLYSDLRIVMWDRLASVKPDVIFFIGDTVYSDNAKGKYSDHSGGEENFWSRFADSFLRLQLYRLKDLIPTLATWDDHDFGCNVGGADFKEKHITNYLFDLYWGNQQVSGLTLGPGVSKIFEFNGQRFFFSDNRNFRLQEYWGSAQEDFLFENLAASTKPTWIFDGSQIFGAYRGKETLEGKWHRQLKSLIERFRNVESPLLFGSGDVHYSETMNLEPQLLGYASFEFTSSFNSQLHGTRTTSFISQPAAARRQFRAQFFALQHLSELSHQSHRALPMLNEARQSL